MYVIMEIMTRMITAMLGTANMLRKVLMGKYITLSMGKNVTRIINCNYRIAATIYNG